MHNNNYILTSEGRMITVSDEELYHYGVKGMKWGHRKAQKYAKEARTYRQAAKDIEDEWKSDGSKRAAKFRSKGKESKARAEESWYKSEHEGATALAKKYEAKAERATKEANFQKAQADIGKSRKLGHKLATNVLAGPFANRTYNSVIAAGGSRVKAAGVTLATGAIGGPLGHIAVAHLYTKSAGDGTTRKRY